MNTEPVTTHRATESPRVTAPATRLRLQRTAEFAKLRAATPADAPAIHALIEEHLAEGHLLPRSLDELSIHAARFIVAIDARAPRRGTDAIVACAELAPLSAAVAEVRSLVVHESARARGVGRCLIDELRRSAARAGFDRLCAFTHDAGYFVRKGFTIVPHEWLPEKIARDCVSCALFRTCGQHAVVLPLRG